MAQLRLCLVLFFALKEILALQENTTSTTVNTPTITTVDASITFQLPARRQLENGQEVVIKTRRKNTSDRSTSSSSGSTDKKASGKSKSSSSWDDSLSLSSESSSTDSSGGHKKYERKSSAERKGWRKWHRKCQPCPEEMALKWKDQNIKWICGAYQRAQRSFKSLCMMHYRNCQDGTMFTKIHDYRCVDDDEREGKPHGDHFFYTYSVLLSADSSTSISSTSLSSSSESDIYKNDGYV